MKRRAILFLSTGLVFASVFMGACGYVKVFNGSGPKGLVWGPNGYSEELEDKDEAAVKSVAASLDAASITFSVGDSADGVTTTFTGLTTLDGCSIAWSASDGSVVTFEGGVATVVRPASATDATITLTATITKGDATATKSFTVVVKHQVTDAEAVAACKATLSETNLTFATGETSATVKSNIGLPATISDCDIGWSSDTPATVSNSGVVTRPGVSGSDTPIALTATITRNGNAADTKPLQVTVLKHTNQSKADECAATLNASAIALSNSESSTAVKTSFTLPSTFSGCTLGTWVSDNGAISISGTAATVNRPLNSSSDATVNLTVPVSYGGVSASTSGSAQLVVSKYTLADMQAVVASCKAALTNTDITYGGTDTKDSVTVSLSALPATKSSCSLSWASSDTTYITNAGVVSRQHDAADTSVTMTAEISYDTASDTKPFPMTVKTKFTVSNKLVTVSPVSPDVYVTLKTLAVDTDGHTIDYRACISKNHAIELDTIAHMDAAGPICQTINTNAANTDVIFSNPGNGTWYGRIYAKIQGEPNSDTKKILYNLSSGGATVP